MKNNSISIRIEILLVAVIAICMLVLINFTNNKIEEVLTSNNSIILRDNPDAYLDTLLGNEFKKYELEPCTITETYDSDFTMRLRVPFSNDDREQHRAFSIKENDGLKEIFNKYPEGHTRMRIGEIQQDIYFRWTDTNDGQRRLVIVYLSRPIVKNLWIIPSLCYFILILIFILVVRLRISYQKDRIAYYQKNSTNIQNILK